MDTKNRATSNGQMLPRPTGDLYELFFRELSRTCNVTGSAAAIGVSRQHVHHLRRKKPEFAKRWEAALQEATDALEAEARRRAMEGYQKPVFFQGKQVGSEPVYSDALLITLLKAHRPEKFREKAMDLPPGSEIVITMTTGGGFTDAVDVTPGAPEKEQSITE